MASVDRTPGDSTGRGEPRMRPSADAAIHRDGDPPVHVARTDGWMDPSLRKHMSRRTQTEDARAGSSSSESTCEA